jgi:acylphosphatase
MEAGNNIKAVHVMITGRVQGVGYRAWVRRTADALGISGWVHNCRTGEVEAVFSGPGPSVDRMVAACREGPSWARVAEVRILGPAEPMPGPLTILTDR